MAVATWCADISLPGENGNPIGEPTSVMVRRETLIAAGGFRPQVPQLQDIDAWLRVLSRSDAYFFFVDEELAVRWHHAGSATDAFGGSPTLDKMWVLSDLIRSNELGWALRLRALSLWLNTVALDCKAMFNAPQSAGEASRQRRDQRPACGSGAFASV